LFSLCEGRIISKLVVEVAEVAVVCGKGCDIIVVVAGAVLVLVDEKLSAGTTTTAASFSVVALFLSSKCQWGLK
jgi:hypothetical protein